MRMVGENDKTYMDLRSLISYDMRTII